MYISLTEEKVNYIYDDRENDIADTDKLAKYEIVVPVEEQIFTVGSIVSPTFTITKNGIPIQIETTFIPEDKKIVKFVNGQLTALKEGETYLTVQLKDYPTIEGRLKVVIGKEEQFAAYIEGNDSIRLGREAVYNLVANAPLMDSVKYSLSEESLAFIINVENNSCRIRANEKNKLGKIKLISQYQDKTYEKEINIIPLW